MGRRQLDEEDETYDAWLDDIEDMDPDAEVERAEEDLALLEAPLRLDRDEWQKGLDRDAVLRGPSPREVPDVSRRRVHANVADRGPALQLATPGQQRPMTQDIDGMGVGIHGLAPRVDGSTLKPSRAWMKCEAERIVRAFGIILPFIACIAFAAVLLYLDRGGRHSTSPTSNGTMSSTWRSGPGID